MKNKRLQSRFTAKRSEVVLTAVLAAVIATGVSAQERPNFTGAWRVSESAAGSAGGEEQTVSLGSGWGESFTLVHASDLLTVERVLYRPRDYQPTMRLRYALDGTESKNTILMGRGLQIQVSTATWESDKLVITTVHTVPDVEDEGTISCEVTRTLSLQLPQQAVGESSLVVETNRCGVLGGLPSSTRTVYNRN
jgi:hypothetical protein